MTSEEKAWPVVLSIAGSDSGGCSGIQADIKSIAACGGFPVTVITAVTAQNTRQVSEIFPIPPSVVAAQLEAVFQDYELGAVKIGMVFSEEIAEEILSTLDKYKAKNVVIDPVMRSSTGRWLSPEDKEQSFSRLYQRADLLTPNLPEAELLSSLSIVSAEEAAATAIAEKFQTSILLKGGHSLKNENHTLSDVLYLYPEKRCVRFQHERIETRNSRGTGCSLSSAIATFLAKGAAMETAVQSGIDFIQGAMHRGRKYELGHGHGPIKHI